MKNLKLPPSSRQGLERFIRDLSHEPRLSPEKLRAFQQRVEEVLSGGFDHRGEANGIVAMAFRNGPIENLHAGEVSPLLDDDALSRITDVEMKAIMIFASRTIAMMLRLRDEAPENYREYLQAYADRYCRSWERTV